MTKVIAGMLLLFALSGAAYAQTAQQYFTELRDANTFNKYSDKYVCFSDDDVPSFAVVSTTQDVVDAMTRSGYTKGAKTIAKYGDGLFVRTYYKGVANGDPRLYDKVGNEYRLDFDAPIHHGRMVYKINWKTGRYRFQVYARDYNKNLPASERSGKCELIHPDDTPSVAAEK